MPRNKITSDPLREMRQCEEDELAREGCRFYLASWPRRSPLDQQPVAVFYAQKRRFVEMNAHSLTEVLRDDPSPR